MDMLRRLISCRIIIIIIIIIIGGLYGPANIWACAPRHARVVACARRHYRTAHWFVYCFDCDQWLMISKYLHYYS